MDKFIEFFEMFDELNEEQKKWVYANLNHIICRFNEKFNKNVTLEFS